ncbi:unnamed protein product, partial [Brassica rapa]
MSVEPRLAGIGLLHLRVFLSQLFSFQAHVFGPPFLRWIPTWSKVSTTVFSFYGGSRYVNLFTSFAHCLLLSGPSPLRLRSVCLNLRSVNLNVCILVLFRLTESPVTRLQPHRNTTSNHNFRRLDLLCSRGST